MPGIDGFETCTQMRKSPKLKKTPIIMLSAKTSPLDEVKGVMAGCTTYMTKPIVHEEFQKVIRRISKWIENISKKKQL
jgi:twitching motility two-component system response regulator PilG